MTKIKILTFFAAVFIASTSFGQTKTTKELTDKFFETFSKSPDSAIDWAFAPTCMSKMQNRIKALKAQTADFIKTYGWYIGNEQVSEKAEGNSVKITTFIVKYDCQPIEIKFVLYKAKDDWTIADLFIFTSLDKD